MSLQFVWVRVAAAMPPCHSALRSVSSVVGRLLGLSSAVPEGPCDALLLVLCMMAGASPCRWLCCMAMPCGRVGVIVQVPFEMVRPELA